MITVLVVDDEKWARDEIVSSVNWEAHGFRLLSEAGDGIEALTLIRQLNPDIVLADIQIPGIDGIELLRRSRESGNACVFIYFSGFDRFEYAKSAVNLGAIGYILKPVDEKELLELLLKAKELIEEERKKTQSHKLLMDLTADTLRKQRSEFIRRILQQAAVPGEDLAGQLQTLDMRLAGAGFTAFSCEIDRYPRVLEKYGKDQVRQYGRKLQELFHQMLAGAGVHFYLDASDKGVDGVINYCSGDMAARKNLLEACEKIIEVFAKEPPGLTVTIGIGKEVTGLENIHASFVNAGEGLERRIIAGGCRVIEPGPEISLKIKTVILDPPMLRDITECLEKGGPELADRIVGRVKERIQSGGITVGDIRSFNYHFVEAVFNLLVKVGGSPEELLGNPRVLCDEMDLCEDADSLAEKINATLQAGIGFVKEFNQNYHNKLLGSVKKYIDAHYMKDISLESIAQEFKFHPNYLSKLFKEETGQNFIEYLTFIRISKGKELLADLRHNVLDVALMVGYKDAKYFTKVFKKVVGVTPSEYIGKK